MGLAPFKKSNPNSKSFCLANLLTFKLKFLSINKDSNSIKNLSTTFIEFFLLSILKLTVASSRFLNSGLKNLLIALLLSVSENPPRKPTFSFVISFAPILLVIIKITFVKSIFFPRWSVNLP